MMKTTNRTVLHPFGVALAGGVFWFSLLFGGQLHADPPDVDEPEREIETSLQRHSLTLEDGRPTVDMEVLQHTDQTRQIWHVEATPENQPDNPICRSTLPREAGRDLYEHEFEHLPLSGGGHVVLLTARIPRGEGPLDPTTYQLAFYLWPREGPVSWSCTLIGRGEYTELDGGPRLRIEDIDDRRRLTRRDEADEFEFCGLRPDEQRDFEVFDETAARFVPGTELDIIADDADELTASVPDDPLSPPYVEDFYTWMSASSDIRGAPTGTTLPRPLALGDLDLSSVWLEGVDGLGQGEFVTAAVDSTVPLRAVRIFPGHGASEEAFYGHARPTRILVALSDGQRYSVDIPEVSYDELIDRGGIVVEFPEPITSRCISAMILDARQGEFADADDEELRQRADATAIAEITPYSSLDAATEAETAERLIREIAREPSPRRRDRIAEFGTLIPSAMVEAIAETLREDDEALRRRVIPLLRGLDHQQSLPVLRRHFHRISPEAADYRPTKRALAAHGTLAAPTLLEILDHLELEDRKYVDVVRIIGRVGSEIHLTELIDGLGTGERMLRSERIRALSHGGTALVAALINTASSQGDSDAGLDALTALVFIGRRHHTGEQLDVAEAAELQAIYDASDSRPHRIRAIEAMGYFNLDGGAVFLGEHLVADDPDPVIRRFAAGSLKHYPSPGARRHLETALHDSSPDVRIAAIRALNHRDDSTDATASVIDYAHREVWPRGLHHALQLLAESPQPEALDALVDVVERDIESPAARTALRALRRAERALPAEFLLEHLAADGTPDAVRAQLVQLMGYADPDPVVAPLMAVANREFAPLQDQPPAVLDRLADRAFLSLGKLGVAQSRDFLVDVVTDGDRPMDDRSDALRGLGFYTDRELVERLREIADDIPSELNERFRMTLAMIQNRLGIEEGTKDIQDLIDRLDEEQQ